MRRGSATTGVFSWAQLILKVCLSEVGDDLTKSASLVRRKGWCYTSVSSLPIGSLVVPFGDYLINHKKELLRSLWVWVTRLRAQGKLLGLASAFAAGPNEPQNTVRGRSVLADVLEASLCSVATKTDSIGLNPSERSRTFQILQQLASSQDQLELPPRLSRPSTRAITRENTSTTLLTVVIHF